MARGKWRVASTDKSLSGDSSLVFRTSYLVSPPAVIALILLAAFALRVWNLTGIPPGLTHDEANHGREAIGILNGVLLYFFPLNYGSEPIYSYTVALFMAALGRGLLALRLVNVIFSTAAIAVTYAWAAPRLGRAVALLGAALMAVSFWPLAAGREALRAGMLPFFMALAVLAFWRLLESSAPVDSEKGGKAEKDIEKNGVLPFPLSALLLFSLSLALTLHVYLAARVSWLVFPAFVGYLALIHRGDFRRVWRPALAGLLLAGLLVAPLFLYLRAHPEMQTRLDMLDRPLQGLAAGNVGPLLLNVRDALLAFVWPGFGDQFLAYNIPGRPVFDAISAVCFVVGLLVCLWRWRRPGHAFLLLWFVAGILPSLITGPTANTTRNAAALPAAFLIAAAGFEAVLAVAGRAKREKGEKGPEKWLLSPLLPFSLSLLWLLWVAFISGRDYFVRWGDSPAVRGAYQHTLVAGLNHITTRYPTADPVLFSTVYPGPAHDSSIALVLAAGQPAVAETARWVDARRALVIPSQRALAYIPYATPPHPAFIPALEAIETVDLRPDDLDPRFTLYWIDGSAAAALSGDPLPQPIDFNGAIELTAARWMSESVRPGDTAELLTVWRVLDPARGGPVVPPSFTTDAVMFTHVLDNAGGILAQHDGLDAPSWAWRAGDVVLQVQPVIVPVSAAPGDYPAVVGIYDRASGARLPAAGGGDTAAVPALPIVR